MKTTIRRMTRIDLPWRIGAAAAIAVALGSVSPLHAEGGDQTGAQARPEATQTFQRGELVGTDLYDWGEQKIGNIKDVVRGPNDRIRAVLIEVGGYLGMGGKTIAVAIEQIQKEDGRLVAADLTRQQAENMPEFDKEAVQSDLRQEALKTSSDPRSLQPSAADSSSGDAAK